jgi:hypothetical protein
VGDPPGPFRPASIVPAPQVLHPGDALVLTFAGGEPDAASVDITSVVVRDGAGVDVGALPFVQDGALHVGAPAGGWPLGALVLELHAGLSALDGAPLAAPLAIPLSVSN